VVCASQRRGPCGVVAGYESSTHHSTVGHARMGRGDGRVLLRTPVCFSHSALGGPGLLATARGEASPAGSRSAHDSGDGRPALSASSATKRAYRAESGAASIWPPRHRSMSSDASVAPPLPWVGATNGILTPHANLRQPDWRKAGPIRATVPVGSRCAWRRTAPGRTR
jgi:hypothetical protein